MGTITGIERSGPEGSTTLINKTKRPFGKVRRTRKVR